MATKIPNGFIGKILNSKKYYAIDTMLGLCFMSSESNDKKFYVIKTEDFSIISLAKTSTISRNCFINYPSKKKIHRLFGDVCILSL